jgi:hypothetical protein
LTGFRCSRPDLTAMGCSAGSNRDPDQKQLGTNREAAGKQLEQSGMSRESVGNGPPGVLGASGGRPSPVCPASAWCSNSWAAMSSGLAQKKTVKGFSPGTGRILRYSEPRRRSLWAWWKASSALATTLRDWTTPTLTWSGVRPGPRPWQAGRDAPKKQVRHLHRQAFGVSLPS